VIAVDGKTLRGSGTAGARARHLLAALDHGHGVILGQVDVEARTNEIPMFATLLDRIDLAGAVITADALHAQPAHAEYLAGQRGAHYLITVKGNQPALRAQLAGLPWWQIPAAHDTREKGHGRAERRMRAGQVGHCKRSGIASATTGNVRAVVPAGRPGRCTGERRCAGLRSAGQCPRFAPDGRICAGRAGVTADPDPAAFCGTGVSWDSGRSRRR
jgi:predicted transposase YbfD/YdcC